MNRRLNSMKTIKKIGIAIIIIIIGVAYAYGTWPRPIYNTDIGSLSYEKRIFSLQILQWNKNLSVGITDFPGLQ